MHIINVEIINKLKNRRYDNENRDFKQSGLRLHHQ